MIISAISAAPFAAYADASGDLGTGITYSLDSFSGLLTISGKGIMKSYSQTNPSPLFSLRTQIKSVYIDDGVETIGDFVFANCESITSVTLPASLRIINEYAFYDCSSLTSVMIPKGTTSIDNGAFLYCSGLQSINVQTGNSRYDSRDSCNAIIETSNNTLIVGCDNTVIPSSVKKIGNGAFGGHNNLTSIDIPYGVEEIDTYAFSQCVSLQSISLPKTLKKVYSNAFYSCNSLKDVYYSGLASDWNSMYISSTGNNTLLLATKHYPETGSLGDNVTYALSNDGLLIVSGTGNMDNYYGNTETGVSPLMNNTNVKRVIIEDGVTNIGVGAFYGCQNLKSVEIPDSVTEICGDAFINCSSLTGVEIPSSVTHIWGGAFEGCSSLKSIAIPDSVDKVEGTVFKYCENLTSIYIGKAVKYIGPDSFFLCYNLKRVFYGGSEADWDKINIDSGNTKLTDAKRYYYKGSLGGNVYYALDSETGVLTISGTGDMDDFDFAEAPFYEFREKIKTVKILEGVTSISTFLFYNCVNITSVTLPDGLITIGKGAFETCRGIKTIDIPSTVTSIGREAFSMCLALTNFTFPSGITTISPSTFNSCSALEKVAIPATVTNIEDFAFAYSGLKKVHFGGAKDEWDAITIGTNNNPLINADVYFSEGSCGASAIYSFDEATGTLTISGSGAMYDYGSSNSERPPFEHLLSKIQTVVVRDGVTSIGDYAFQYYYSITTVVIPDSVKTIGGRAFYYCDNLETVYMGSGVTSIGYETFNDCNYLKQIYYKGSQADLDKIEKGSGWETYISKVICNYTGTGKLGASVTYSFDPETGTVTVSGSGAMYDYDSSDNKSPFYKDSSVKAVIIQHSISHIGDYVFSNCDGITSLTISSGVASIGEHAFYDCDGLTSLTIPSGVQAIGYRAFAYCKKLKTVVLADSVSNIGSSAFLYCRALKEVTFGLGIQKIQNNAFEGCTEITTVNFAGDEKHWNAVNIGINNEPIINVKPQTRYEYGSCGEYMTYKLDKETGVLSITGGSYMYNYDNGANKSPFNGNALIKTVVADNGTYSIGDYAFYGCTELTSVTLGHSVYFIGASAFENCSALTEIDIETCTNTIKDNAFSGCNALDTVLYSGTDDDWYAVAIGSGNEPLLEAKPQSPIRTGDCGENATYTYNRETGELVISGTGDMGDYTYDPSPFDGNSDITSVVIEGGITSVGNHAFTDCDGIKEVTMENGVTSIGAYAFENCDALESVTLPDTITSIDEYAFDGASDTFTIYSSCALGSLIDGVTNGTNRTWSKTHGDPMPEVKEDIIDPTCTTDGSYTSITRCSVCNEELFKDTVTVDALGHEYMEQFVQEPTCTQDGYTSYACIRCGNSYDGDLIPMIPHTPGEEVAENEVEVTCMTSGSYDKVTYCSMCGTELSRETVFTEPLGHDFTVQFIQEPTCTSQGFTNYVCTRCSESYDGDYTDSLGHDYVVSETDATCTEEGTTTYTCSRCGDTYTEAKAALGHEYVSSITEPTCTNEGYTTYTCSRCGDEYTDDYVGALGHAWDDGVVTVEPTEFLEGIKTYTCTRCGETKIEVLPNLGHEHSFTEVETPPTCTEKGYVTISCDCGYNEVVEYADALGHDYIADVKEATCLEGGSATYTCSRCGDSYTTTTEALGHDYVATVFEPTCTEGGFTGYKCSRCGDMYVDSAVDALGHDCSVWTVMIPAKCSETGVEKSLCSRCGETVLRVIDALGHDFSDTVVAPTCTNKGYTSHTCSRCGDSYTSDEVDALGHVWNEGETTAVPSCETAGAKRFICTVCGESKVEEIPATGHTAVTDSAVAPTFDKAGKTAGSHCSVCGKVLVAQTTVKKLVPSATTFIKVTSPKKKQIKLTWKKQTKNTTGYEIQYSTNKKFAKKSTKTVTVKKNKTTKATIKKLKSNKKYFVRIRTYKQVGKKKYYSFWSKSKTVKVK